MPTAGTAMDNKLVQAPKFIGVSLTMEVGGGFLYDVDNSIPDDTASCRRRQRPSY